MFVRFSIDILKASTTNNSFHTITLILSYGNQKPIFHRGLHDPYGHLVAFAQIVVPRPVVAELCFFSKFIHSLVF